VSPQATFKLQGIPKIVFRQLLRYAIVLVVDAEETFIKLFLVQSKNLNQPGMHVKW
jgi:hypothetical protein